MLFRSKWADFCAKLASTQFLAVVAAVWFGCNNAARDIVGETAIFRRERMVNLRLPSYVFSKLVTMGLICFFQCAALLAIIYVACSLRGPIALLFAILFTASLVGTSLGLLISALAPTTESAIAFLPLVLLPFILLAGGIKPLHEMPAVARWIAAVCPTRWAYEASLLQEAGQRHSAFRSAVGPPSSAVALDTDVASAAFPGDRRSSLGRSFEILGITFGACVILVLCTLTLKSG